MTLEEAIQHCREKANGNCACAEDHRQLAAWLTELKAYRTQEKRSYRIYAVDFDGTVCENNYPETGAVNGRLVAFLIDARKNGNKVILNTCRTGELLEEAVRYCRSYGLVFDAVNENLPEMIEIFGGDSRKIAADVYIDDKAIRPYEVSEGLG